MTRITILRGQRAVKGLIGRTSRVLRAVQEPARIADIIAETRITILRGQRVEKALTGKTSRVLRAVQAQVLTGRNFMAKTTRGSEITDKELARAKDRGNTTGISKIFASEESGNL